MSIEFNGFTDGFYLPRISGVGNFTIACKFLWPILPGPGFPNYPFWTTALTGFNYQAGSPFQHVGYQPEFDGAVMFATINGVASGPVTGANPSVNSLHRLVIRRLGTTISYWLDGVLQAALGPVDAGTFTLPEWSLGVRHDTDGGNIFFGNWRIGRAGLWLSAWSDADIAAFTPGADLFSIEAGTLHYQLPLDSLPILEVKSGAPVTVLGSPTLVSDDSLHAVVGPTTVWQRLRVTCTVSWTFGDPGAHPVSVTPTCPAGTFSPPSATLANTPGATTSFVLSIDPAAANGPADVTWALDHGYTLPATTLTIVTAPVRLDLCQATPSGNNLRLTVKNGDGSHASITGFNLTGVTYRKNGGDPVPVPMLLASAAPATQLAFIPLNSRHRATVDDAAATTTGTRWTTYDQNRYWQYYFFYNGTWQQTDDPSATIHYSFTGLVPGLYQLSAVITGRELTAYYSPGPMTTSANYHVVAGSNTYDFVLDQSLDYFPRDRTEDFYDWVNIGQVRVPGTTASVTLSNAAGSGQLYADAVRLNRITSGTEAIFQPTDTVTLSAPDGYLTTTAGVATALVDYPVANTAGDRAAFYPIPDPPHTLGVGFNIEFEQVGRSSCVFANRWRGVTLYNATGTYALDGNGEITTLTPGSSLTYPVLSSPTGVNSTEDFLGNPNTPRTGTYRIKGFAPSGLPTISVIEPFGGAFPGQPHSLPVLSAPDDPITGKKVWTVVIDHPHYFFPFNWAVVIADAPLTEIEFLDPLVPDDWTSKFHPVFLRRMAGASELRPVVSMFVDGDAQVSWSERQVPTKIRNPAAASWPQDIPLASAHSVDMSGADLDQARKFFGYFFFGGKSVVRLVTRGPHGLGPPGTGRTVGFNLTSDPLPWPDTAPNIEDEGHPIRGTWDPDGKNLTFVIDETTVISALYTYKGDDEFYTITGDHTFNTSPPYSTMFVSRYGERGAAFGFSIEEHVDICNEVGCNFRFQPPHGVDDDYITQAATLIAGRLNPGLKCLIERSNETWNGQGGSQNAYDLALAHATTPPLADYGGLFDKGRMYHGRRSGQVFNLFDAAWVAAGRSLDERVRIIATWTGNEGAGTPPTLAQMQADGFDFDRLDIAPYFSSAPFGAGSPYYSALGGLDLNAFHERLDERGLVEQWHSWALYGGFDVTLSYHRYHLDLYGFSHVYFGGYEGTPDTLCAYGGYRATDRNSSAFHNPDMFYAAQSWLGKLEGLGLRSTSMFGLTGGSLPGSQWTTYVGINQGDGTGDLAENPNPLDYENNRSQVGGGYHAWQANTPTPTPTVVIPTPTPIPGRKKFSPIPRRKLLLT